MKHDSLLSTIDHEDGWMAVICFYFNIHNYYYLWLYLFSHCNALPSYISPLSAEVSFKMEADSTVEAAGATNEQRPPHQRVVATQKRFPPLITRQWKLYIYLRL